MTGPVHCVRLHGLTIHTDVAIPAAPSRGSHPADESCDATPPDLHVHLAPARPVPTTPPTGRLEVDPGGPTPFYRAARRPDGTHVLRFRDLADMEVAADLATVVVRPAPDLDDDLAGVLLAGNTLSFVLALRGHAVLHASAVQLGDRALAFVGASGMGKSTMATLLCSRGARLVADDVLRVDLDGHRPSVHLGATEARLRPGAHGLTTRFPRVPAERTTGDERKAVRLARPEGSLVPLGALVVPIPVRDLDHPEIVGVGAAEAVLLLARFPRLLGWRDRDVLQRQFEVVGELAARVPVSVAQLPWGPPFSSSLAPALEAVLD